MSGKKGGKTKKIRFRKCGFFVVCPYGPLCHPCGRQERRKKQKKHVLESVFFRGFRPYGPLCQARKEEKTKKERFTKCGFFVVCPYGPLYVTPVGGKKGGKNEKNAFKKMCFFRGFPLTGFYVTPVGGKKGGKNKKKHVLENVVFFVVCPYGPLYVRQERRKKLKKIRFRKVWFSRGLPIRASMSSLREARKEEKTKKKTRFRKCFFFVVSALTGLYVRQERRKKRKKHVLESVVFSWFTHTASMSPLWDARKEEKTKKHVSGISANVVFFRGFPPYGPLCQARNEEKNEKTTF